MSLTLEWQRRIDHWRKALPLHFYQPLGRLELQGFCTFEQLTPKQAYQHPFNPMPAGTNWGSKWQYAWFKTLVVLPEQADGKRIVLHLNPGGDSLVFVNDKAAGARDHEHPYLTLDVESESWTSYAVLLESYGGHGPMESGGGPAAFGVPTIPEPPETQRVVGESSFGIWNEEVYQLWLDVETLYQLRGHIDPNSLRVAEIDQALRQFTLTLDLELPLEEMMPGVLAARNLLKPLLDCKNGSTAPTLYMIGHAHLDVAWLWPLAETERKIARTLSNQLRLMWEYPDYKYNQSQAHLLWMLKQRYPELYEEIKYAANKGQVVPEGGMWVEADTNLTSGESLIRQFLYGKRFFQEELGVDCKLLWLPDVFGYSGALPQILRGCGIEYFATQKIFWTYNGGDPFPYNLFTWEGIDGSEVLAHIFYDYNSLTSPDELVARWNDRVQKDYLHGLVVSFGHGDGGGGPTRDHLEFLRREADLEGMPRTRYASPLKFFEDAQRHGLPPYRYVGELYFQAHRGTYTSQARTKANNRRAELALREAELWSAAALALQGWQYPIQSIEEAWRSTLLLQFHDILPGSSIQRVYQEAEAMHAAVIQSAKTLASQAQQALLPPDAAGQSSLTVFNSLSWRRKAQMTLPDGFAGAKNSVGKLLPAQIQEDKTWVEAALPPCGWTTLQLVNDEPAEVRGGVQAAPDCLENEFLMVKFNPSGEITTIYDKEAQLHLAAGTCNHFEMFKDVPNLFDAWDIDSMAEDQPVALQPEAQVEVTAQGALFGSLRVKRRLNHSTLEQTIRLESGSRVIRFETSIDWQESHKLLKVAFPVNFHADEALHEIQFGHIRRPTHRSRPFDAARFEVSNHKWSALCAEKGGAAILNDSKYGISVLGNTMHLTLLKSALAPDMSADKGRQQFTYAFYCWTGSLADSGVVQRAYELNIPVTSLPGALGTRSLFSVDAPNIIIETVKPADAQAGSGAVVVRLYESMRSATCCTLSTTLPVSKAAQTNMLEQFECELDFYNNQVLLDFRPFEVKTVRLVLSTLETA